jgi:hypothetical protein
MADCCRWGRLNWPKTAGPQAPTTAVDESGWVSADYSDKVPWNKVSDNTMTHEHPTDTPMKLYSAWMRNSPVASATMRATR